MKNAAILSPELQAIFDRVAEEAKVKEAKERETIESIEEVERLRRKCLLCKERHPFYYFSDVGICIECELQALHNFNRIELIRIASILNTGESHPDYQTALNCAETVLGKSDNQQCDKSHYYESRIPGDEKVVDMSDEEYWNRYNASISRQLNSEIKHYLIKHKIHRRGMYDYAPTISPAVTLAKGLPRSPKSASCEAKTCDYCGKKIKRGNKICRRCHYRRIELSRNPSQVLPPPLVPAKWSDYVREMHLQQAVKNRFRTESICAFLFGIFR